MVDMVSEHEEEEIDGERYGRDESSSAECQRRLWGAEPARRDDVLPFFVWSIVHDRQRSEVALNALLDVRAISLLGCAWAVNGYCTVVVVLFSLHMFSVVMVVLGLMRAFCFFFSA